MFPDRFTLGAATSVITFDGDEVPAEPAFQLISRLVDRSLLVVDVSSGELRYRLLGPVRRYAADRLADAKETNEAERRHCAFFVALAKETWTNLGNMTHVRQIMRDMANYQCALERAWRDHDIAASVELGFVQFGVWVWECDPQVLASMRRVVAEHASMGDRDRAHALRGTAVMMRMLGEGDHARQKQLFEEAAEAARASGDVEAIACVDFVVGEFELGRGRTAVARVRTESALHAYERTQCAAAAGWCHHHLGWVAVADQDVERARTHFTRAIELTKSDEDSEVVTIHAVASLAPVLVLLGDADGAMRWAERGIADARRYGIQAVLTMALARGAETAVLAGALPRLREILRELLGVLHSAGPRRWTAEALQVSALLLAEQHDAAGAAMALAASETYRIRSGEDSRGTGAVADALARTHRGLVEELGAEYPAHHSRGSTLSPDEAIVETLAALA